MGVTAISMYRPVWADPSGRRTFGHDEDEVTAAVAALLALPERPRRVVLVTATPDFVEGDTSVAIATAIGDETIVIERRLGGAVAALDAVLEATPGTAVVAIATEAPSVATAVLIGDGGLTLDAAGSVSRSLPIRTRRLGDAVATVYDDPRLLRERGWKPAVYALAGDAVPMVVGVPSAFARTVGDTGEDVVGPAVVLAALAAIAAGGEPRRLIAVDGASGLAADVAGTCPVTERAGELQALDRATVDTSVDIPISLAAYDRAFGAKLKLEASRCECGTLEFPPRAWCSECGQPAGNERVPLPRSGVVYTTVTVSIPVPGTRSPYSIAIVDLDGVDLRVLAHVTGAPAGAARIGDRGELVLRRVAVRSGVPDYGYAFQPQSTVLAGAVTPASSGS